MALIKCWKDNTAETCSNSSSFSTGLRVEGCRALVVKHLYRQFNERLLCKQYTHAQVTIQDCNLVVNEINLSPFCVNTHYSTCTVHIHTQYE